MSFRDNEYFLIDPPQTPVGDVDAGELSRTVMRLLQEGQAFIILDLRNVEILYRENLSELRALFEETLRRGARLGAVSTHSGVRKDIQINIPGLELFKRPPHRENPTRAMPVVGDESDDSTSELRVVGIEELVVESADEVTEALNRDLTGAQPQVRIRKEKGLSRGFWVTLGLFLVVVITVSLILILGGR